MGNTRPINGEKITPTRCAWAWTQLHTLDSLTGEIVNINPHVHSMHLETATATTTTMTVAPVCSTAQKVTYGIAKGESAQISCDVDADPSNVTFKWFYNDFDVRTEIRSFISNGSHSLASFSSIINSMSPSSSLSSSSLSTAPLSSSSSSYLSAAASSSSSSAMHHQQLTHSNTLASSTAVRSFGKMICLAENSIGRQKEPCIFTIIPASKSCLSLSLSLSLTRSLLSFYLSSFIIQYFTEKLRNPFSSPEEEERKFLLLLPR